jgi:hypothetical protein
MAAAAALGLAMAWGCSSVVGRRIPQAPFLRTHAPWDDGYKDFSGVIHVHTDYSHDAHGHFEEAMRVANALGLDFLVLTEHNTLQPLREGKQGWHGATMALIGVELNTDGGHYLALNVTDDIDGARLTTQQVIDEVERQGGLGFIAHPHFKKHPWTDWSASGFAGCEMFNVARDILDGHLTQVAMWTMSDAPVSSYLSLLERPDYPLRTWDALIARHGRVVGLGGADAHEFHLFGMTFAPYDQMFRMVRTHVLLPTSTLTAETIYDALRRGHAYVGVPLVAQTAEFSFMIHDGHAVLGIMGDEVVFQPGLQLSARLPLSGELTLFRDGKEIANAEGQTWEHGVSSPGVYRLEVSREGKPWLFSNPIYVRPTVAVADPATPRLAP